MPQSKPTAAGSSAGGFSSERGSSIHIATGGAGGSRLQSFEDALYAVLFVMQSRTGTATATRKSHLIAVVLLIVDWAQLMAFVADSKRYNWLMLDWVEESFRIVMGPVPRRFLSSSSYTTYIVFFALVMAVVVLAAADVFFVLHCFRTNQFRQLWPIKALKFIASVFFGSLYLSSFGILFMSLDCHYFDTSGTAARFTLTTYPAVACWGVPNGFVAVIAGLGSLCVLVFAFALTLVTVDPVPSSKLPSAIATPHSAAYGAMCRALLVVAATVFSSYPVLLALVVLAASGFLAGSIVYYLPHYEPFYNNLKAALYGVVAWCSVCALAISAAPQHPRSITLAFVVGALPVFALCWAAAHVRFRRACHPARHLKLESDGFKPTWVFRGPLYAPHEVEIATRFVRDAAKALSGRGLFADPNAALDYDDYLEKADAIFREGIRRFPSAAIVYLAYANFLRTYMDDRQGELSYVDRSRHLQLDFQLRFLLFRKLKEREGEAAAQGGGAGAMDLVSFVELKTKMRLAREGHYKALKATRAFWASLLEPDENEALAKMSSYGRIIDVYEVQAERNYSLLVESYPRHIQILRSYGAFLESVKNDPAAAESLYRRADAEEEEQSKKRAGKGVSEDADVGLIDHSSDAIVVIDSNETILSVNANAGKLLGYDKAEMKGKKATVLMPTVIAQHHQTYVQTYLNTGITKVVNRKREVTALHKNGHIIPVRMFVTRMDVAGKVNFVGSMRPLNNNFPLMLASIGAAGRIVGCNVKMTSLFELSAEELQRKSVKDLVAEHHASFFFKRIAMPNAGDTSRRGGAPSGRRGSAGALALGGEGGGLAPAGDSRPGLVSSHSFRARGGGISSMAMLAPRDFDLGVGASDNDDEESRLIEAVHAKDGASFQVVATIRKITAGAGALLLITLEPVKEKPGEGMLTADARGVILSVNRAAASIFGYEPSKLVKERLEILMPLPYSKLHAGFIRNYMRTGVGKIMGTKRTVEGLHRSGTTFPMSLSVSRTEINGETIFTGTVIKLDQSDESADDVYITINQQGVIQSVRGPIAEMFGYRPTEIVNRPLNMMLPRNVAAVHDQYVKRIVDNPSEPRVVGTAGRTIEAVRKDGSLLPIQIDISADESLKESGVMLFVGRITQLIDLEALITVDASGRIMSCNYSTYRIFGYSDVQDLTGTDVVRLLPGFHEDQEAMAAAAPGVAGKEQEGGARPVSGKHASGHTIPLTMTLSVTSVSGVPYTSVHLQYRNERRRSRLSVDLTYTNRGHELATPSPGAAGPELVLESLSPQSSSGAGPADAWRRGSASGGQLQPTHVVHLTPLYVITESTDVDGAPSAERGPPEAIEELPAAEPAAALGPNGHVYGVLNNGRSSPTTSNVVRQPSKLVDPPVQPRSSPELNPKFAARDARQAKGNHDAAVVTRHELPTANGAAAGKPTGGMANIGLGEPTHRTRLGSGGGGGTQSITSSHTSHEKRRKRRRRVLAMLATRPNPLVKKLWRDLVICQIVLATLVLGTFVAVTQLVDQYAGHLHHLSASSRRTVLSQLMAIEARTLGLAMGMALGAKGSPPGEVATRLWDMSSQFIDVHQDLTYGLHGFDSPEDSHMIDMLFSPTALPVIELRNHTLVTTRSGLWTLGEKYHYHSLVLTIAGLARSSTMLSTSLSSSSAASAPAAFLPESIAKSASVSAMADAGVLSADPVQLGIKCAVNLKECSSWYFVTRNGPFSVLTGLDEITSMYVYMMRGSAKTLESIFIVIIAVGFFVLLVMGCVALYPTFSRVLVQRDEIMILFLHIPRAAVKGMSRKRVDITLNSSESSEGELDVGGSDKGEDDFAPPPEQAVPAAADEVNASTDGSEVNAYARDRTRDTMLIKGGEVAAEHVAARVASALATNGAVDADGGSGDHTGPRASRVLPRGSQRATPSRSPAEGRPPASVVGWLQSRVSGVPAPPSGSRRALRPDPSTASASFVRNRRRFASASSRLFGRHLLRLYTLGSVLVAAFILAIFISGYRAVAVRPSCVA